MRDTSKEICSKGRECIVSRVETDTRESSMLGISKDRARRYTTTEECTRGAGSMTRKRGLEWSQLQKARDMKVVLKMTEDTGLGSFDSTQGRFMKESGRRDSVMGKES